MQNPQRMDHRGSSPSSFTSPAALRIGPSPRRPTREYHRAAMPRLAANLSYLFTDRPFPDRFGAAAACGFRGVEHQFPYREASESAIPATAPGPRPRSCSVQPAAGGGGRAGARRAAGPGGGVPGGAGARALLLPGGRLPAAARDVGGAGSGDELRGEPRHLRRQPARGGAACSRGRCRPARGAAQPARQSRLSPQPAGRCARPRGRGGRPERQGAARPLPLPDRGGRRSDEAQALARRGGAQRRAHPDRVPPGPDRARCG